MGDRNLKGFLMAKPKRIYKDWDDWWRNGDHGCSSASRDFARQIWDDLEPTITANRSDWESVLRQDAMALHDKYTKKLRNVHNYLTQFDLEKHAPVKFFRWLLDEFDWRDTNKKKR
jgi:hypothetical protein